VCELNVATKEDWVPGWPRAVAQSPGCCRGGRWGVRAWPPKCLRPPGGVYGGKQAKRAQKRTREHSLGSQGPTAMRGNTACKFSTCEWGLGNTCSQQPAVVAALIRGKSAVLGFLHRSQRLWQINNGKRSARLRDHNTRHWSGLKGPHSGERRPYDFEHLHWWACL